MRIKSLTMRIWLTVSLFIVSIVLVFLLVFTFVLGNNEEEETRDVFVFAHAVVLNDLQEGPLNDRVVDSMESLPAVHFVYDDKDARITHLTGSESRIDDAIVQNEEALLDRNNGKVRMQSIDHTFYLIQISRMADQAYLISYQALDCNEDMIQIVIAGILIVLFSLPIAKLLANNIGKPLKALESYTKKIANKDWDSELVIKRQDEIGRLASSMKEMKEALRIADEEERKFLQSISHDLKTPVMIISSYAQAIIDGMYDNGAEEPSVIIKAEAVRLEKKIKQILYLNTLDYVMDNDKTSEDVHLDKLLTYLVANFQAVDTELQWELQIEAKPAVMSGNADRLRVSIENVMDNQLRFARKSIQVSLKDAGAYWHIEIRNDGPLLSDEEQKQLFRSFYKGVKGNFGLGLSITRKIVDFYGGAIDVDNRDGYVCFIIQYPKRSS
ncbi:two-component system sensor histidine kinase CssS [Paenibacillus cellulosilyticus]|uniref:histidine kinase n=1 Tax=Paenibacillus cellulosilyticus TaxID=375489 RepID=A0A2V2Z156_9BACL|nr:HAMP domain-containing sensor histidine kinase [Paenibacillus cellulosilyticus]PWW07271.1 two-component system sensor histidine kinase CssS [Paenibacillus cellulosilyticus]QKS44539.1 HAMP domain-containing histidine kinase [Paenibacillus cellulosilyticus]